MERFRRMGLAVFVFCFFLLCLIPSAGMLFVPEQKPVGNEQLASAPELYDQEGNFNRGVLADAGNYLADHIAFRHELITLDSQLCSLLFGAVPSQEVLLGENGWLFYQDALPDYLGTEQLTWRQCFAAARSLGLIEEYCAQRDIQFLFTIAPNKNSLYPENMPARYQRSSESSNAQRIAALLPDQQVEYLDLFAELGQQKEILYFRTDSHWNNLGAALAGDLISEALNLEGPGFAEGAYTLVASHRGDLYEMVYPAGNLLEQDAVFERPFTFSYAPGYRSPEDITIRTTNPNAEGSLLMFRDSFGNALHPFLAERFGSACFSRAMPYDLSYLERENADTLVVELVERNLSWLTLRAPILPAPVREISLPEPGDKLTAEGWAEEESDLEGMVRISGGIHCPEMDWDSPVYLGSSDGTVYEATPAGEEEQAFTAYLPRQVLEGPVTLSVSANGSWITCELTLNQE